jgi:hypothetical protein
MSMPITVAARKLESWVGIPLEGMDVCVRLFWFGVVLCVDSGLSTG